MKDNNSKQVLLSVLGVAILVVAVVGVSFAAFSYTDSGTQVNTITTGSITMSYSEDTNGISLKDALPMTDEQGKALTGENNVFDFTITASVTGDATINYAIIAAPEDSNSSTFVTDDTVKVYLTDTEDAATGKTTSGPAILSSLPASSTVSATTGAPNTADDYVLANGTYSGASNSDSYRLRMWIDGSATAPTTSETYKLRVRVYGQADAQ